MLCLGPRDRPFFFPSRPRNLIMTTEQPTQDNKLIWAGRILSALPVFALLGSGVMKISQSPQVIENFAKFGYQPEKLAPIGIVELLCTILYLIPQTSVLGAILLTGYLGGATATHVRISDAFLAPVLIGMMVWGGLFLRDPRIRALIPLRR